MGLNIRSLTLKRVGIALGGGGARGIAHIAYLKALEDLGVRPVVVSGTSSGSIAGALYCSGMMLQEMIGLFEEMFGGRKKSGLLAKIAKQSSTLVSAAARKTLADILPKKTFEELLIPLKVVATNINTLEERVFDKGNLLDAVMCSVALPGSILPQRYDGQYYIDGGATNIVPFDIISSDCEVLIAIDVSRVRPSSDKPDMKTAHRADWAAAQQALISVKQKFSPIDVFERPTFDDVGTMEFEKMMDVYKRAEELVPDFKRKLEKLL